MNAALVPTGFPACLARTSNPSVPDHPPKVVALVQGFSLLVAARQQTPYLLRKQRVSFPHGSLQELRSALAGSPVILAKSSSSCVVPFISCFYGRDVHLRQLPTTCSHDAVAFGYKTGERSGNRGLPLLSVGAFAGAQMPSISWLWQEPNFRPGDARCSVAPGEPAPLLEKEVNAFPHPCLPTSTLDIAAREGGAAAAFQRGSKTMVSRRKSRDAQPIQTIAIRPGQGESRAITKNDGIFPVK